MYRRYNPYADISYFPVISLGTKLLDSRLISCLMESLSYNDLLDWNTDKMVELFPEQTIHPTITHPSENRKKAQKKRVKKRIACANVSKKTECSTETPIHMASCSCSLQ
jgi:hypothetical protein